MSDGRWKPGTLLATAALFGAAAAVFSANPETGARWLRGPPSGLIFLAPWPARAGLCALTWALDRALDRALDLVLPGPNSLSSGQPARAT